MRTRRRRWLLVTLGRSVRIGSLLGRPLRRNLTIFVILHALLENLGLAAKIRKLSPIKPKLRALQRLIYVNGLQTSQTADAKNRVCQKTKTLIGVSEFCVEFSIWRNESTVVLISQNNVSSKSNSAPVYLRLVATVFKKVKDEKMKDGVMFYNLTFGRGPDLPFHPVVRAMVDTQHKTYIDGLVSVLHE